MSSYNVQSQKAIGILDSGVGGLTVLKKLVEYLPEENYLYYGDTKNLPYGNKTPEQLLGYVRNILDFFSKQNVKAVVFGCNTTAAVVYDIVKNEYPFKIYPIIQDSCKNINPLQYKSLGVFATQATVNSKAYTKSLKNINNDLEVIEMACPMWVNFVENSEINTEKCSENVKEMLDNMQQHKVEKIILGCTHYPYLLDTLSKFLPKERFINPAEVFALYIKQDLQEQNILNTNNIGSQKFFVSSNPIAFKKSGEFFYPLKDYPTLV